MTKPVLHLHESTRSDLGEYYDAALAALQNLFTIETLAPKGEETTTEKKLAEGVAAALDGVVMSTDIDSEFYPCVLTGIDPSDVTAFHAALGIAESERFSVGGYDNPKLAVSKKAPLALTTLLNDHELDDIGEYVLPDDQKAHERAGKLLSELSPPVGVVLCAEDHATKVAFTLAKAPSGAFVGILALRSET